MGGSYSISSISSAAEDDAEAKMFEARDSDDEQVAETEGGDTLSALPVLDIPDKFKNRKRRKSVSAESDRGDPALFKPAYFPKTAKTLERIRKAVAKSFLFSGMSDEQQKIIFGSMQERKVKKGTEVIKEGDPGDFFYVISEGDLDVFEKRDGEPNGERKIWEYRGEGSFGELALMYNARRIASIRAVSDCVLWAVDGESFRAALIQGASQQRERYERLLSEIPLFDKLSPEERAKFADSLVPTFYEDGRVVVEEGRQGDKFFIVESGEAVVKVRRTIEEKDGTTRVIEEEKDRIVAKQYFGDVALIADQPRNATVYATGELKVATMDLEVFERLMGRIYVN